MTLEQIIEQRKDTMALRREVNHVIVQARVLSSSRERALALTKLQEAQQWLTAELEILTFAEGRITTCNA